MKVSYQYIESWAVCLETWTILPNVFTGNLTERQRFGVLRPRSDHNNPHSHN